jgi:hypothetical protein
LTNRKFYFDHFFSGAWGFISRMRFRFTSILWGAARQKMRISVGMNRSLYRSMISMRSFTTDKNASKSNTTNDSKDAAGFDIFEQLKAKQSGKGSSNFDSERDPREEERFKREAEKAEKEVKQRQNKSFWISALVIGVGSLGAYLYLGNICQIIVTGLESDDESNKNPDENAFEAHNRRAWNSLKEYIEVW